MTDLRDALSLFSKETVRLEKAYHQLGAQYQKLHSTLENIVSHSSEGFVFISMEGTISLFNRAAGNFLGIAQSDVLEGSFWSFFADDFFGFSMRNFLEEQKRQVAIVFAENTQKEVEISASFVPEKGALLLLRDITELRQLKETAERNDRLRELGEMAAALAHEIRNPLGGIEGFASILLRDLEEKPEEQNMAKAIIEGTRSLNRLVSHVLHFARPLEMHFAQADLIKLVEEVCALVKADPNVSGEIDLTKELSCLPVSVDASLVKMALLNVIRNGLEASPEGQKLSITVNGNGVVVKDKGEGIAHENLEKIFMPFFSTKSSGTGLGLSEAQKIISSHGGEIVVESGKGEGTTFVIKLPKLNDD